MIYSLKNLEEKLLSLSSTDDIVVVSDENKKYKENLTSEQVRKEISIVARILVNGYCGWPFHTKLLKYKILSKLNKLFDAANPISTEKFLQKTGNILIKIPDAHLSLFLGDKWIGHKKKKFINIGNNIGLGNKYVIKTQDELSIIAVPKFIGAWINNSKEFVECAKKAIDESKVIIIDLRGNIGGNSQPFDAVTPYLYGTKTPSCKRSYVRGTPEGEILRYRGGKSSMKKNGVDLNKDPALLHDNSKIIKNYPNFCGIEKPIYILVDGVTASGGEMVIAQLSHHPFVKIVGTNTRGCEIYGNITTVVLPSTGIRINVGNEYRELEVGNIELKGYVPDIKVKDREDAFLVAKADFVKFKSRNASKEQRAINK